jgi:transcription-repair coupling factor (superfamily II helicase)
LDYKVKIQTINNSCEISRLCNDAQAFITSLLSKNFSNQDLLFVAENDAEMEVFEKQLYFFAPHLIEKFEILHFPAWDCLPYDRTSPKQNIMSQRIKTLYKLANRGRSEDCSRRSNFIIITSSNAILQKVVSPDLIKNSGILAAAKSKISTSQIAKFLVFNGYQRQSCANNAGEFAIRGGIVDIVMQQTVEAVGYRLDFFGEEVESIKAFDPLTQMSQETLRSIEILPASEVVLNEKSVASFREKYRHNFGLPVEDQLYSAISEMRSYPGMEHWLPLFYDTPLVSFFDYLQNPVLFLNDRVFLNSQAREKTVEEYYKSRLESVKESKISGSIYNPISPDSFYLTADNFRKITQEKTTITFNNFTAADTENKRVLDFEVNSIPDFALAGRANKKDPIDLMQEFVQSIVTDSKKQKVAIACLTEGFKDRLIKLLLDFNLSCQEISHFADLHNVSPQKIAIFVMPLGVGFITSDLILIGEQAIFGEKVIRKKTTNKAASQRILEEGLSINLGELVVHRDHGIAKFDGIHTIASGNVKSDFLKLIYANNDSLFVPVDDINSITRYGADNPLIQLDRLGGGGWKNRKSNVKKKIRIAAIELIKIAAARHVKKSPILIPDTHWYEEFKARFPFVETEDQLKAINEIEEDLQKGSPMDRLICGDVGFGKTEVAMRAAAIAARNENKRYQVAIVAPTTLLTRQHFHNFVKRFDETNVKIAQLSRLVGTAEAKKTKEKLESGEIDIVIGTHALLNKNIKFKNLGLVIIDEEQHFGVAQKERLKEFRNEVHILTLSATPIPRTLQMSLAGVKELSLIATPPVDRLAVRNFVMPYDSVIVKEAILREYQRSGKVFFVVPRIKDIAEIEERLAKLLPPEIRVTHAHGQMTPSQLDKIMNDFYDSKIDVLLSTTIIESGIDITDANTMIIYRAEMFGLSQLYQLRGRVGRGKIRAYAYFMMSPKKLAEDARKKLEVMQNLDSLGVGFTVASYDMDIRGSGDLLGAEQSGHVRDTGIELYQQMLLETIEDLKNIGAGVVNEKEDAVENDFSVQIKLGISLLIPEVYVSDLSLRMSFYKKIMLIKTDEDQEGLTNELNDRFGVVPSEVSNLMEISKLKWACKKIEVEKLEAVADGVLISFKDNKFAAPEQLMQMIFSSKSQIKLHLGQKVLFLKDTKSVSNKIRSAFEVVKKLESLISELK